MNWNFFADEILRGGELKFKEFCTAANIPTEIVDSLIAAETQRQQQNFIKTIEEVRASAEAIGITDEQWATIKKQQIIKEEGIK